MSSSPSVRSSSKPPSVPPPLPSPVPTAPRSSCVYGDSTPFPHEGNFIELIRHAVDCGVALLASQHVVHRAIARTAEVNRAKHMERARLEGMNTTLKRALASEMSPGADRLARAGARIVEHARIAIEAELVALESSAANELGHARLSADQARNLAQRALETFLLNHDLPGTEVGLSFTALDDRYAAQAQVATPFGVEAGFELQIPTAHEWGRHVRVGDLNPGTEVHVPAESGLFFKKVAVQPVKLDRLYVSALHVGFARGALTLRRQATAGAGYKIDFDTSGERTRVLIVRLGEDGSESMEPAQTLEGEDAVHVLRLWRRVLDSTEALGRRRHAMTRAAFEGHPITTLDQPSLIAEKLVRLLAPTVLTIAQRAGAPGELVLRRDVRAGRREEIYITKAELHEKVLTLPPLLRGVFDPFELDSPRSPRAPAPSIPAYSEAETEEAIELSSSALLVSA
jgi:hypothetical protein